MNKAKNPTEKKHVYIVSLFTYTPQAYLIRARTGEPHTHASMGLERPLKELYSYNIGWKIVDGGFAVEKFSDYPEWATVQVIRAEVPPEKHKKLHSFVNRLKLSANSTSFNYMGIAMVGVAGREFDAGSHAKYCSQFIKHALLYAGLEDLIPERARGDKAATPYSFTESKKFKVYAKGTAGELAAQEEGVYA